MGAALAVSGLVVGAVGCGGTEWTETPGGTLRIVTQEGGPTRIVLEVASGHHQLSSPVP
jgi:hypothetical protein